MTKMLDIEFGSTNKKPIEVAGDVAESLIKLKVAKAWYQPLDVDDNPPDDDNDPLEVDSKPKSKTKEDKPCVKISL